VAEDLEAAVAERLDVPHEDIRIRHDRTPTGRDGIERFERIEIEWAERAVATDGGETTVCPTCDSAEIRVESASTINHDSPLPRYACHECGARFDEPATRERTSQTAPNAGTAAAALHEMDPDDLVTDGGQPTGNSADGSERFELARSKAGEKTHLVFFDAPSLLALGSGVESGYSSLCGVVTDRWDLLVEAPENPTDICQQCAESALRKPYDYPVSDGELTTAKRGYL